MNVYSLSVRGLPGCGDWLYCVVRFFSVPDDWNVHRSATPWDAADVSWTL